MLQTSTFSETDATSDICCFTFRRVTQHYTKSFAENIFLGETLFKNPRQKDCERINKKVRIEGKILPTRRFNR